MDKLKKQQGRVALGMAAAVLLALAVGWFLYSLSGAYGTRAIYFAERLAHAAKWALLPGLTLLLGVAGLSGARFFTTAIDPLSDSPEPRLVGVLKQYNQNTLEQLVLFLLAAVPFAAFCWQPRMVLINIVAILFVIGRVAFFAGYAIRSEYRALGFALTFFPNALLFAAALWVSFKQVAGIDG